METHWYGREILGLFLLFISLLLLLSLLTFDPTDPALNHAVSGAVKNKGGLFGAYTAGLLNDFFGVGSLLLPLVTGAAGGSMLSSRTRLPWWRWLGFLLVTFCLLATCSFIDISLGGLARGGLVGNTFATYSAQLFSSFGAFLFWLFCFCVGIQLFLNLSWQEMAAGLRDRLHALAEDYARRRSGKAPDKGSADDDLRDIDDRLDNRVARLFRHLAGDRESGLFARLADLFGNIHARREPMPDPDMDEEGQDGTASVSTGRGRRRRRIRATKLDRNAPFVEPVDTGVPMDDSFKREIRKIYVGDPEPELVFVDGGTPLPPLADPQETGNAGQDEGKRDRADAGDNRAVDADPGREDHKAGTLFIDFPESSPVDEDSRSGEEQSSATPFPVIDPVIKPEPAAIPFADATVSGKAGSGKSVRKDTVVGTSESGNPYIGEGTFGPAPLLTEEEDGEDDRAEQSSGGDQNDFFVKLLGGNTGKETVTKPHTRGGTEVTVREVTSPDLSYGAAKQHEESVHKPSPADAGKATKPELPQEKTNPVIDKPVKVQQEKTGDRQGTEPVQNGKTAPKSKRYPLPSLDIFNRPEPRSVSVREDIEEQGKALMNCLSEFNIKGDLMRATPGPVVTTFMVRPAPGVSVSKFVNRTDDIARSLKAVSVFVQAPVPGTDTVGIVIPRMNREIVNFREIAASQAFREASERMALPLIIGKDTTGRPYVADLAKMPHLLVAGATGQGKSVCLNTMLSSLLLKKQPSELKLLLVDPKRVEMTLYEDESHLIHPVVKEIFDAKNALAWAVREMDDRYDRMSRLNVKNIAGYNEKFAREAVNGVLPGKNSDLAPMPYIVIVVDELADLMLQARKEVEPCIIRLAQLARACGIHMIIATQRPSVDVVTGLIKANFPCRICFTVSQRQDSMTTLGQAGAERLLGNGDMFFNPNGGQLTRLHGPYLHDSEVQALVDSWRKLVRPEYGVSFTPPEEDEAAPNSGGSVHGGSHAGNAITNDPLYEEVLQFVSEQNGISTSLLQRRFSIGFNKAAKFVEQLEREGRIGSSPGAGKLRPVIHF